MLGIGLIAKRVLERQINYDSILEKSIVTIIKLAYAGQKEGTCAKMLTLIIWDWGGVGWNLGRNISPLPGPPVLMLYPVISQGEVLELSCIHGQMLFPQDGDIFFP